MRQSRSQPQPRKIVDYRRERLIREGVPRLVPAVPVGDHVRELLDLGLTATMIAAAAGTSDLHIWNLASGKYPTTQVRHAAAVMAVTHHPVPQQRLVMAIGAHRRVRALAALGWSFKSQEQHGGLAMGTVNRLCLHRLCTYMSWQRVDNIYRELSMTRGPSKATAGRAAAKGWLLPLEWEYHDIDDPRVVPSPARPPLVQVKKRARTDARLNRQERVARMVLEGVPTWVIAEREGVTARQIERDRHKLRVAS